MNARQLPLLCHNTNVYPGPYVPTTGLRGHIHAEGLSEHDLVEIYGVTSDASVLPIGTLTAEVLAVMFPTGLYVYVRACRAKSGGNPVSVWAA